MLPGLLWAASAKGVDGRAKTTTYQSQTRVKALFENGVHGVEDEAGQQDLVAAFVYLRRQAQTRSGQLAPHDSMLWLYLCDEQLGAPRTHQEATHGLRLDSCVSAQ